ncbi:hypothetical protein [uncultured Methylovirgula sp.]|uniref:hypothetical protein n=1 Tax=uncultured Methylovirgula sp. TaxID=1285960 RepID=UPI00261FD91B|nr:hypothetical protein [uncultured Methylovirgula sp.]
MTKLGARPDVSETGAQQSHVTTLSELLLRFIEANPEQLVGNETAEEWVASLWKVRNPAAKLKKSLDEFLAIFEPFDGSAANALRKALEPLTK